MYYMAIFSVFFSVLDHSVVLALRVPSHTLSHNFDDSAKRKRKEEKERKEKTRPIAF